MHPVCDNLEEERRRQEEIAEELNKREEDGLGEVRMRIKTLLRRALDKKRNKNAGRPGDKDRPARPMANRQPEKTNVSFAFGG
jgi:hypothetical protein